MDCKYMIEINDKGLFQDLRTGLKYHEITREMIEGCLDDEIDMAFEESRKVTPDGGYPSSRCFKLISPGLYSDWLTDYMKRNNIIPLDCEEGVRYFEFDEDANDVR